MSEVICPFCGAPNPPEAETCKVCNNPLVETAAGGFNLVEGDQPEWLKDLRNLDTSESGNQTTDAGSNKDRESSKSEDQVPEWLLRIRQKSLEDHEELDSQQEQTGDAGENSGEYSPVPSNELPSWLFSDDQTKEQAEASFSEPADMDWMDSLKDKETPDKPSTPPAEDQKKASDWDNFPPASSESQQEALSEGQDLPAGSGLSQAADQILKPEHPGEITAGSGEKQSEFKASPEYLESSGETKFATEFPDFPDHTIPNVDAETANEYSTKEGNEFPQENQGLSTSEDLGIDSANTRKRPRLSLRDELLKAAPRPAIPESSLQPEIEQAKLPGWLEAMKPVESVAPAHFSPEADQQVENTGPLAGFQGVLPGGNLMGTYSKPPVYSFRLKVSDKQLVYSSLLENLIAEEPKAPPVEAAKPVVSGIFIRLAVAVALIGILIFILITGLQIAVAPNLFAPETVGFFDSAKQLITPAATPARILVAVEFEPGLFPELQAAASYPLQQLLESGANITLVSTLPTGPALGEKLVADAGASVPQFQPDAQVINLGYLVGGSASLASLAVQPALAAPATLGGQFAWNSPILQGIHSVADFDGLILLTDNPELSRAWVEQVQPALAGKPLLVISSAQSAPMILPYYNSGQIQGLLTGLNGGAVYDQLAQRSGSPVSNYWSAYQAGLLVAVLAILIGASFYGILGAIRTRQPGERS